jgi:hypothetical protein
VFSADELAQLRGFPEIGRAELIRFFMLTPADEEFVRRFRDKRNVLGAAVQLCTLPWLGFVPEDVPSAPAAARRADQRLAQRLQPAAALLRAERGRHRRVLRPRRHDHHRP